MSAAAVLDTAGNPLVPGAWYCVGFEVQGFDDPAPRMDWGAILRYEGPRQWYDDDGNRIEALWDPELQYPVAMDAADAYAKQG